MVAFIISSTGTAVQVYVFLYEIGREAQNIPDVNVPAVLIEETRLDRLDPVGSTSIVVSC